jgi:2,5-diketo-D-gluconate reductase A
MNAVPGVTLHDGVTIPQLGFGVFQIDQDGTVAAVGHALRAGYRHVDTAAIYGNEEGVGQAIAESGLGRDEVFVTTKLWNDDQGYDATLAAFDVSAKKLRVETLDLYLIHWPTPARDLFVDTRRALEQLRADGRVRSIGVSNFRIEDLRKLQDAGLSLPSVNQIELHPHLAQAELRAFHAEQGIATEAWSPLAQGAVLGEQVIAETAAVHGVTPAQVVLAWHLALGNVVIPKSVTPSRIAENLAATRVRLSVEEIEAISALDRNGRTGPDPATLN